MVYQLDEKHGFECAEKDGYVTVIEVWLNKNNEWKPVWVSKKIKGEDKFVPSGLNLGKDRSQARAFAAWLMSQFEEVPF